MKGKGTLSTRLVTGFVFLSVCNSVLMHALNAPRRSTLTATDRDNIRHGKLSDQVETLKLARKRTRNEELVNRLKLARKRTRNEELVNRDTLLRKKNLDPMLICAEQYDVCTRAKCCKGLKCKEVHWYQDPYCESRKS